MRKQIRFRRFQLAQRFSLLRFVFGDPGGFFENRAPIFRTRAQDQIDLALLHDGVGAAADAGVGEQALDVLQPADRFVEQILGIAIAINAPGHAHLVPVDAELLAAIR